MLDTPEEVAAFVRAIVDKVKEELRLARPVPATVQAVGSDGIASVVVDGDEDDATTRAEPTTGDLLRAGQRVFVTFQPGGGCFVTDVIQSGFGAVGLVVDHVPTDADYSFTPPDGTIAANSATNTLYMRIGGTWRSEVLT